MPVATLLQWLARGRTAGGRPALATPGFDPLLPLHAYRLDGRGAHRLPILESEECTPPLPEELLAAPGRYRIGGGVVSFADPGVYRIYQVNGAGMQRLVVGGSLDETMRLLGWMWHYGSSDDPGHVIDDLAGIEHRPPFLGCGNLACVAVHVLGKAGVHARRVALSSTRAWNGYDDGHTLTEVLGGDGAWFTYDPSFHCIPHRDGRRLSIVEFNETLCSGADFTLERLPGNPAVGPFRGPGNKDHSMWIAERFYCEESLRAWYCNLAGVPLIADSNNFFAARQDVPKSLMAKFEQHYRMLDRDDFLAFFY